MIKLGQFFTREPFSKLLTESIEFKDPKIIIDLGIGDGSLTTAAQAKWKYAKYFGVDVDIVKVSNLLCSLHNVTLHHVNSLDTDLSAKINVKVGSVDIAICNPPYLNLCRSQAFDELLLKVNLNNSIGLKSYTTDLLFFAQNLFLLKPGGVVGIILPAGLLCGHEFLKFRQDLLNNHTIETVIELRSRIFKKTDAKTFILIVRKGITTNRNVVLRLANEKGVIIDSLICGKDELYRRMDFTYHSEKFLYTEIGISLKNIGAKIKRGNYTHLELAAAKVPYFHTINFKEHQKEVYFPDHDYSSLSRKPYTAVEGDILLGRVGKTCHKQILLIKHGKIAITDCVYRIELPMSFRSKVFRYLSSKVGQDHLRILKHGVCAQVLSKSDLENMLINIEA